MNQVIFNNRRCAVICERYPFPPRDGITIPVEAYITYLIGKGFAVDLFVLSQSDVTEFDYTDLPASVNLKSVKIRKYGIIRRTILELLLIRPSFHCFSILNFGSDEILSDHYDVCISSPIAACGILPEVEGSSTLKIYAVNDSIKLVDYNRGSFIHRIRSMFSGYYESRIYKKADQIWVQSQKDLSVIKKYLLPGKVRTVPNGVPNDLFNVSERSSDHEVAFVWVVSLTPYYKSILFDFVLPSFEELERRGYRFNLKIVAGGCMDEEVKRAVSIVRSVTLESSYIPSLRSIYEYADACIAPVFKNYGRINKVIEAIAAGRPVIGDVTAFNSLGNVPLLRRAVFEFEDMTQFVAILVRICESPDILKAKGVICRKYAQSYLSWERTFRRIDKLIGCDDETRS
ncbi:MAG: glycosyltransferase [Oceanospirillaceae bacterium]|nr:glycosyltransferase [Oceanospirillaceae bacterium]